MSLIKFATYVTASSFRSKCLIQQKVVIYNGSESMIAKIGKHMVVSKNKFLEMHHMLPDLIYTSY